MKKLRCAILDDYQNIAMTMADWSTLHNQVEITPFHQHFGNEEELIKAIADCEIVILMRERTPFNASILSRLPHLKLLITTGMRNASIDLSAASANGVTVCGTRSQSEPPTELTWALILGVARKIVEENNSFRMNGHWQNTIGLGLHGKQLGILGCGKIGGRVAQIGLAFGMNVMAWSQNLTLARTQELGIKLAASKEELLETSDFISIHLVLSERTNNLIGKSELQRMRSSAYLINTSRAQIVDQNALVEALQNKWIAGAGIDVFDTEPLSEKNILRSLPTLLATPHLGYVTQENYQIYYQDALEDITAFLHGSVLRQLS